MNPSKLRNARKPHFQKNTVPANGSVLWIRLDDVPVMGRLVVIERQRHGQQLRLQPRVAIRLFSREKVEELVAPNRQCLTLPEVQTFEPQAETWEVSRPILKADVGDIDDIRPLALRIL